VGVKPNTWKKWGFGVLRDSRMFRARQKGPNHLALGCLDICRSSYGQKKGRESNWQFDSRPLKVENRPAPDVRFGSAIRRWKDLDEGYNFGWDFVAIRGQGEELWPLKVPGVLNRDTWLDFGTPTWESREKEPLGCGCGGASQSILYGGWWWHPRVRAVVCFVVQSARGLSQHPRVSRNVN
jgi:hypothetical protein